MSVPRRKKATNLYLTPEERLLLYRLASHEARDGEDPMKARSYTAAKALRLMWESLPQAERRRLEKIDMPSESES